MIFSFLLLYIFFLNVTLNLYMLICIQEYFVGYYLWIQFL